MTDSPFDAGYYADLEPRVKALICSAEGSLTAEQSAQLLELAQHNEPGVAVEMLSEILIERGAVIAQSWFDELHALVETMRLDSVVSDRLRSLVHGE